MIPSTHHGSWRGRNSLWLEPGKPPAVSEATMEAGADLLSWRWSFDGGAREGSLRLFGPAPSLRAQFADTFHAAAGLALHGFVREGRLMLYGTYATGEGQPEWGWRLELDWADPGALVLRMFNLEPSGVEEIAVDLRAGR